MGRAGAEPTTVRTTLTPWARLLGFAWVGGGRDGSLHHARHDIPALADAAPLVAQVDGFGERAGPRWRLMVFLGAYGPMRPEEQAELRRKDVDVDGVAIRIRLAAPELTTGHRALGGTKSQAGKRLVVLRRHLDWYAEKGPDGLLFVGEKDKPFRRSTFGRKRRKARAHVGLPDDFRFYDLRHTGHTLTTRSGATLKDTMARAGQSSERAALIYQHSDQERQKEVASGLDSMVRRERQKGATGTEDHRSGTQRARES